MTDSEIKQKQYDFYKKRKTGCSFAAIVARNSADYNWYQEILRDFEQFDTVIETAIVDKNISTLSLILPDINSTVELCNFIKIIESKKSVIVEKVQFEGFYCFWIRIKVGTYISWVTGFGNYSFFPLTRQAPFTELAFRVKPSPEYEWPMKATDNAIHLANLDMHGISKEHFKQLWDSSLLNTEKILGHKSDLKSSAKSTFAIPTQYFDDTN